MLQSIYNHILPLFFDHFYKQKDIVMMCQFTSSQMLNAEINKITNSIALVPLSEIDETIQSLIKNVEKNRSFANLETKENLNKLKMVLEQKQKTNLGMNIQILCNSLFDQAFQKPCEEEFKTTSEVRLHYVSLSSISTENVVCLEMKRHQQAYASLTRRLTPAQQQEITLLIQQQGKEIDKLCEAAKSGNLNHPIFDKNNMQQFPCLALAAFKEAKLSSEDFSALMVYWSILKHHDEKEIQTVKLFNEDGNVNPQAQAMLQNTMKLHYSPKRTSYQSNELSEEQFTQFYEELKNLSPLQQQFWIIEDLQGELHKAPYEDAVVASLRMANGTTSISQAIFEDTGINTFSRIEGSSKRIIPTLSMVQAFLNAKYETPVQLETIIGFGNIEDLRRNGLTLTRIVSLAFPFEECSNFDRADGFMCHQVYDMTYHDAIYHGDVVSAIPPSHQQAYIFLADAIQEACHHPKYEGNMEIKALSEEFYNRLVDMEFEVYRQEPMPSLINCLHFCLTDCLTMSALGRLSTQALMDKVNAKDADQKLTYEEVQTTLANSSLSGMRLLNMYTEQELMDEIGKIFVTKLSGTMSSQDLQEMSIQLGWAIRNNHRESTLSRLMYLQCPRKKYKGFPEAILGALDKYIQQRAVPAAGSMLRSSASSARKGFSHVLRMLFQGK